jgi:predicted transcriptional regulator
MARAKTLNMDKLKATMKKTDEHHKDLKTRIRQAIDDGEHKTADTAIKLLTKSRDGLHKLIEHVEGHSAKKRPKTETAQKTT